MLKLKLFFSSKLKSIFLKFGYMIVSAQHKYYDPQKYLLVEKNKFMLSRRQDKNLDPVKYFVNDESTYNRIWGSDSFMERYLDEQRVSLFSYVIDNSVRFKNILSVHSVIDVGCGTGDFLKVLIQRFPNLEIFGTDYSEASIERSRKLIPHGTFDAINIFDLQSIHKKFDIVFCMEVLEHIEFPEKAIHILSNICNDDGLLIITVPNGSIDDWIGHINFWQFLEFKELLQTNHLNVDHCSIYDKYFMLFICSKPINKSPANTKN